MLQYERHWTWKSLKLISGEFTKHNHTICVNLECMSLFMERYCDAHKNVWIINNKCHDSIQQLDHINHFSNAKINNNRTNQFHRKLNAMAVNERNDDASANVNSNEIIDMHTLCCVGSLDRYYSICVTVSSWFGSAYAERNLRQTGKTNIYLSAFIKCSGMGPRLAYIFFKQKKSSHSLIMWHSFFHSDKCICLPYPPRQQYTNRINKYT